MFKVRKSRSRIQPVPPVHPTPKPGPRRPRPGEPKPKPKPAGSWARQKRSNALVAEYLENAERLDGYKALMQRQDEILATLVAVGTEGTGYTVADAFDGKPSAWKSVCFRRFELVRGGK